MYAGEIIEYGTIYDPVSYTHLDVYKRQYHDKAECEAVLARVRQYRDDEIEARM